MTTHFRKDLALKKLQQQKDSVAQIYQQLIAGNKYALSKGITLIESTLPVHKKQAEELIQLCLQNKNESIRIGITGVPGVGKSTFIESFGQHLTQVGKKVAVLAIDPSSGQSKGSILGDKTRMEQLSNNPNAFIRPSASGSSLGGVARKTRESIILCEAAGFDTIIIETVGVGQSETTVESMVDFFLLLMLAGAGDELQGIKRGIMEMADAIAINKADGDNIKRARSASLDSKRALKLYPPKYSFWETEVVTCSAIENLGIKAIVDLIFSFEQKAKAAHHFENKRAEQAVFWMHETIKERKLAEFYNNIHLKDEIKKMEAKVKLSEISSYKAAERLLSKSN